jgi:hypothetical protein
LPVNATASRQVRAEYTADLIVVYQAFPPAIADAALHAQTFVAPFSFTRMTWIKPSFLWMMYRSGWATKPGQERILAVSILRDGFEWALEHSCLSHYVPEIHGTEDGWAAALRQSPVRVQWDPERDLHLRPQPYRTIQIGLEGAAARHYVDRWIRSIRDITLEVRALEALVRRNSLDEARDRLPKEIPYPLPSRLRALIGMDSAQH